MPELRVDRCDHHGHVGDAAVRDEDLGSVEDPFVAVELGGGAERLDVGSGAGLRDGVGAELDLVAGAVALRHPAADLLRRAGGGGGRRPAGHVAGAGRARGHYRAGQEVAPRTFLPLAALAALTLAGCSLKSSDGGGGVPASGIGSNASAAAKQLGFPTTATK